MLRSHPIGGSCDSFSCGNIRFDDWIGRDGTRQTRLRGDDLTVRTGRDGDRQVKRRGDKLTVKKVRYGCNS